MKCHRDGCENKAVIECPFNQGDNPNRQDCLACFKANTQSLINSSSLLHSDQNHLERLQKILSEHPEIVLEM